MSSHINYYVDKRKENKLHELFVLFHRNLSHFLFTVGPCYHEYFSEQLVIV